MEAALDKRALEPVLIDVSGIGSYTDFIGIVSGRSDRQVDAIAEGDQPGAEGARPAPARPGGRRQRALDAARLRRVRDSRLLSPGARVLRSREPVDRGAAREARRPARGDAAAARRPLRRALATLEARRPRGRQAAGQAPRRAVRRLPVAGAAPPAGRRRRGRRRRGAGAQVAGAGRDRSRSRSSGESWTTERFARHLGDRMLHGGRAITFAIGGADGLPPALVRAGEAAAVAVGDDAAAPNGAPRAARADLPRPDHHPRRALPPLSRPML